MVRRQRDDQRAAPDQRRPRPVVRQQQTSSPRNVANAPASAANADTAGADPPRPELPEVNPSPRSEPRRTAGSQPRSGNSAQPRRPRCTTRERRSQSSPCPQHPDQPGTTEAVAEATSAIGTDPGCSSAQATTIRPCNTPDINP